MGLFDVDGFGEPTQVEPLKLKEPSTPIFKENSLDRSLVDKINPLIKVDVINKRYNLGKLLKGLGIDTSGSNMYCPFHPDEMTGKPSAKYHADTDTVYCFSENKSYSAYHAVKLLYGIDVNKVFMDIWSSMSLEERHDIMDKYEENNKELIAVPSEWDKYKKLVLDKFRTHEVNYRQYKNALYKVFMILNESKSDNDGK